MLSAAFEIQEIPEAVLALATLLAVASLLAVLTRRLRVPLTLILVVVGFVAGELARANGVDLPLDGEDFHDVLIFIFLPVLVFEAALALPSRVFAKHLVPILTLALVALVISAGLVGLMVHFGLGVSLTAALLFGALISATDPVAVTAVFRELGVPKRLLVLVEGESLLNDGIAIVLFEILLVAALGTEEIGIASGVADFLYVFLGGAALGGVLGLAVAEVAARLKRLPSTALTIAVAYGGFAMAEQILGFSGVMASVSAGLVLSGLSGTLIPREEAETWEVFWESLAFVANGLLFLLIGVAIEAELIADNLDSIAIGIGAVVISRPLAIFPVMPLVNRLSGIPSVGWRNQAVVVWGGLRGGVALALALAIPVELPERERFIAMTAGVVLATLVLNASTIRHLIRALGLDQPTRLERFVAAAARFDGARTARSELRETLAGTEIDRELREIEAAAAAEIGRIELSPQELNEALLRRGLSVERRSIEELVEQGLVPQWHGRVALDSLEDQLDELAMGQPRQRGLFTPSRLGRLVYAVARRIHAGRLTPDEWVEIAYRDLHTRLRATDDALAALGHFAACPTVTADAMSEVRGRFQRWHDKTERDLATLLRTAPDPLLAAARRHYVSDLGRLASRRELTQLAELGLVSAVAVDRASELIADHLREAERARIEVEVQPEEDLGV